MRSLSLLALAAPLVSAVNLTSIALNQTVTKGQTLTVKWDSVSTDMPNLSLYLFNFVTWPPFYMPLEFDVHFFPGDSGSANVYIPCKDVASSHGFQM